MGDINEQAKTSEGGGFIPSYNTMQNYREELALMDKKASIGRTVDSERAVNNPDALPGKMNNEEFRRRREIARKRWNNMQPKSISGEARKRLEDTVHKEIEEFTNRAMTKEELDRNDTGAAERLLYYNYKYGRKDIEIKQKLRTLYPDNPNASNLEQYRRKTGTSSFN